jgi:hypothetical protein
VTATVAAWLVFVLALGVLCAGLSGARSSVYRGDRFGALLDVLTCACGLVAIALIGPAVIG